MTLEHAFCLCSAEGNIGYYNTHDNLYVPAKDAVNTLQAINRRNARLGILFDAASVCCACQVLIQHILLNQ